MRWIKGRVIWDGARTGDPGMGIELTNLIRFQGAWYCGFREGVVHHNHPSGRARLICSGDGQNWETAHVFDWDGADVREPKLCVTAEGCLMASTALYFTSPKPREAGEPGARLHDAPGALDLERRLRGRFYQLDGPGTPESSDESRAARQSVTWLSRDGRQWEPAWACPTGINTWRWGVCWQGGMGYSVGYGGKDRAGTLYRTRDGRHWHVLKEAFFPESGGSEAALAFTEDATAWCLLRHGPARMMLGRGQAPWYQEWNWRNIQLDAGPEHGGVQPAENMLQEEIKGPNLLRLSNGRLAATATVMCPWLKERKVALFTVDPEAGLFRLIAHVDGTSYAGFAEHDWRLWVTCLDGDCYGKPRAEFSVALAELPLPD